jgi:hypothetical protein
MPADRNPPRLLIAIALWLVMPLAATRTDAQAKPTYDPHAAFSETDTNHDGAVDHEEFVDRMSDVFLMADVNKDGKLSASECSATLVQTENLSAADSNHDGQLTLHEFMRARMKDYDQADTNSDGLLEIDEVVNAYERGKQ